MLEENAEAKELNVTRNFDISKCKPKVEVYHGMALMEESQFSKEVRVLQTLLIVKLFSSHGSAGILNTSDCRRC